MPSTPKKKAERRREIRDKIQCIKEERRCMECGEDDYTFLVFHHRPGEQRRFWISEGLRDRRSEKDIMAEIEKCDVLCHSCHQRWHWKNSRRGKLMAELAQNYVGRIEMKPKKERIWNEPKSTHSNSNVS